MKRAVLATIVGLTSFNAFSADRVYCIVQKFTPGTIYNRAEAEVTSQGFASSNEFILIDKEGKVIFNTNTKSVRTFSRTKIFAAHALADKVVIENLLKQVSSMGVELVTSIDSKAGIALVCSLTQEQAWAQVPHAQLSAQ